MTFFSTSNLLEIGGVPFVAHGDKPTRGEALEYFRRVQDSWDLNVSLYTEVQAMQKAGERYVLQTNKGEFTSHSVIVCTGFYDTPRLLGIPGEELSKVRHYYGDPHPYVGQKILVIGAANSACDVALETYYKGAEVTMAVREPEIYPRVKYWIRPNIVNRINEGSVKAYFNTNVTAIRETEVDLQTPEGKITIENNFVLAMTGYKPNYKLFEALGLPISDDEFQTPIHREDTLETPLSNVYLAGVINAGLQTSKFFIENTRVHAPQIIDAIKKKREG